jgi:hypothetical protein
MITDPEAHDVFDAKSSSETHDDAQVDESKEETGEVASTTLQVAEEASTMEIPEAAEDHEAPGVSEIQGDTEVDAAEEENVPQLDDKAILDSTEVQAQDETRDATQAVPQIHEHSEDIADEETPSEVQRDAVETNATEGQDMAEVKAIVEEQDSTGVEVATHSDVPESQINNDADVQNDVEVSDASQVEAEVLETAEIEPEGLPEATPNLDSADVQELAGIDEVANAQDVSSTQGTSENVVKESQLPEVSELGLSLKGAVEIEEVNIRDPSRDYDREPEAVKSESPDDGAQDEVNDVGTGGQIPDIEVAESNADTSLEESARSLWTPSYSVSTQGTSSSITKDQDTDNVADVNASEATEELDSAVETQAAVHLSNSEEGLDVNNQTPAVEVTLDNTGLDASPEEPRPKSPWTSSYSVSTQGSPHPSVKDLGALDLPDEGVAQEGASSDNLDAPKATEIPSGAIEAHNSDDVQVQSLGETQDLAALDLQIPAVEVTPDLTNLDTPAEEAKPKSWTPSYSVSTQGSPHPSVKDLEATDEAAVDVSPPSFGQEGPDDMADLNAPELPDETEQRDVPGQSATEDQSSDSQIPAVEVTPDHSNLDTPAEESRPKSPWTPSYSVSNQGSPRPSVKDLEPDLAETEAASSEIRFQPAVEVTPDTHADEPKSWTPSYSVITQGSPLPSVKNLEFEDVAAPEESSALAEPRPWTPSYSVMTQGSPHPSVKDLGEAELSQSPRDLLGDTSATETLAIPESESASTTTVQDLEGDDPATVVVPAIHLATQKPEIVLADVAAEPGSDVASLNADEERPKSPWTPSYSVTNQGTALQGTEDLDDIEQLPPRAAIIHDSFESLAFNGRTPDEEDDPATLPSSAPPPPELIAPEVISRDVYLGAFDEHTSDHGEVQKDDETLEASQTSLLSSEYESTRSRPWTPSYSVTRQGSVILESQEHEQKLELIMPKIDVAQAENQVSDTHSNGTSTPTQYDTSIATPGGVSRLPSDGQPQIFPALETLHDELVKNKSVEHRLAIDDESTDSVDARELPPLATNRVRHESVASSRFFPGGWFSSVPKSPQEGRASLEIVRGEFTPAKSPTESLLSPFSGPNAPPATPVSGVDESEAKKGRWCVVM